MSDLGFMVGGVAAFYLLVVPLLTLIAKLALVVGIGGRADVARTGSNETVLLLLSPPVLAGIWFASSGIHLSEPGLSTTVCAGSCTVGEFCLNALWFGVSGFASLGAVLAWRSLRSGHFERGQRPTAWAGRSADRIERLCASHPYLGRLRISVVGGAGLPIYTRGLLRPTVVVSASWADTVDDAGLVAALLHERAHVRDRDPLLYALLWASLALNPLAFLLKPTAQRWRLARETRCDRSAVALGADPLALAATLVSAARFGASALASRHAPLCSHELAWLEVRVRLLLGYGTSPPARPRPALLAPLGVVLVTVLCAVLPHGLSGWPVDPLHHQVEHHLLGPPLE